MKDDLLTFIVCVLVLGAMFLYVTMQVTGVTAAEMLATLRAAVTR